MQRFKPVAETGIGDEIGIMGAASILAHNGRDFTLENGKRRIQTTADYAASGPNVGKEMLFEWQEDRRVYVRIAGADD